MARPTADKSALLDALAAHVLENGLNAASLRPLAAAAGTSDRMLIYHFGSKDGLIGALLEYLAAELAAGLDEALPATALGTEAELVAQVVALMRSERFKPYTRIWFDILSTAAQGGSAHHDAGKSIIQHFLEWVSIRHPEGSAGAPFALTLIEGVLVMDAVGQERIADAALARAG